MRFAAFAILSFVACVPSGADAAMRWTANSKQGIEEYIIRAQGGARFILTCPSGLEKTNPGFTLESKKVKVPDSETRNLEVVLTIDAANHAYKAECSGDRCEWTSPDAAGQGALEKSVASLRAAKTFVVRIPGLKVSEQFSTLGARKALENALEGCES
jgi:hypothetical protein